MHIIKRYCRSNTEQIHMHCIASLMILSIVYTMYIHMSPQKYHLLESLKDFNAPLPYGSRILIPALTRLLQPLISWKVTYIIFSVISLQLTYFFSYKVLRFYVDDRKSYFGSLVFLCIIPIYYFINFQFVYRKSFLLFQYPYDFPALAAMFAGMYFSLAKRWQGFYITVFLAALNRETALLIVTFPLLFHWQRDKGASEACFNGFLLCVAVRSAIYMMYHGDGSVIYFSGDAGLNLIHNMDLLFRQGALFQMVFETGLFPLIWLFFFKYIPAQVSRLRFVVVFYILILLLVGMLTEARIWGEIMALSFVPCFLGLHNWLSHYTPKQEDVFPAHLAKVIFIFSIAVLLMITQMYRPATNI